MAKTAAHYWPARHACAVPRKQSRIIITITKAEKPKTQAETETLSQIQHGIYVTVVVPCIWLDFCINW